MVNSVCTAVVVKVARTGFWVWSSWAAADVWSLGNIDSPCRVYRYTAFKCLYIKHTQHT